jgi:ClpP class serine protease
MKDYHRLLSRLYNTPLAISQDKLEVISSEVTLKLLAGQALANGVAQPTEKEVSSNSKTAVIKVFDSLVSKGGAGESGFTSYEGITRQIKSALAEGVSKIGFYIDSPGGEAFGTFPLANLITSLPTEYGVETFSFTDGAMHSAAYAIGSAAQRIYATESSSVGSIGTLITLVDKTEADAKDGYKYTILRSKPEKALGSPMEGYSEEAIAKYQTILEEMDAIFNETVASQRPAVSVEDIIAMKGASFMAKKGLELNLIDSIVASFDEVLSIESSLNQPKRGKTMQLEELTAQLSAKEQELATMQAQVTGTVAKAIADERARCLDILSAASTLKISQEQAIKRINAGTSKEDSLEIFTAISEAIGSASAIETATSTLASTAETTALAGSVEKLALEGMEVSMSDILSAAKQQAKGAK